MSIHQQPNTTSGANAGYAGQFSLRVFGWRQSPAAWLSFWSLGSMTIMKSSFKKWEGVVSLAWITVAYSIIALVSKHEPWFSREPWPFYVLLLFAWWGVGVAMAISGFRNGNLVSRACAILSMCAFAYFILWWVSPGYSRAAA